MYEEFMVDDLVYDKLLKLCNKKKLKIKFFSDVLTAIKFALDKPVKPKAAAKKQSTKAGKKKTTKKKRTSRTKSS